MTKQGEVWRDTAVKYAKHIASLEIELRALEAERDALKDAARAVLALCDERYGVAAALAALLSRKDDQ